MRVLSTLLLVLGLTLHAADTLQIFGRTFTVPVLSDWKVESEDGAPVLHLAEHRGPLPGPRRPIQFALTDPGSYQRLTIEAGLKPANKSLMIVFAWRDPAHFDYAHLSTDTGQKQPVHNGVFHVYGGERVRISSEQGPPAFPVTGKWVRVKLVHEARTGEVTVSVDGRPLSSLTAVDRSLGPGQVGFGSFDEAGWFRDVKITAQ